MRRLARANLHHLFHAVVTACRPRVFATWLGCRSIQLPPPPAQIIDDGGVGLICLALCLPPHLFLALSLSRALSLSLSLSRARALRLHCARGARRDTLDQCGLGAHSVFRTRHPRAIISIIWIPFEEHPIKLERYRED